MNQADWKHALELFDEGSELAPSERIPWLDAKCGADTDLRAEVERLLRASDSEDGFLAEEIAACAGALAGESVPRQIGQYRILNEIGRGGMGAVYLAERADGDHERKVAIKLVRPYLAASPSLIRRFRAERRILAGLQHPNIAQMLDGGVTVDGLPYLVMEYVEGLRIDEYCDRNSLGLVQRLELFRLVCSAVQNAHQTLVVHRDIKPSNILVTGDGSPKLLDFGIAKLTHPDDTTGDATFTMSIERPMTLEYASPEQIQGKAVTTATDVYSLGIVLYELLAGERPFRLGEPGPNALLRAICEQEPKRPSEVCKESAPWAPRLRGDLDHIVMMAIRKESLERYQSVEHLSEDIGKYLGGYPVNARRGNRRYRAAKFIRRHSLGVAAGAAFLGLTIAFAAAMAVENARVTRERDIAQRERVISQKVSGFLISLFEASDPFRNNGAQWTARQLLDSGADRLTKELQTEPEVRSELLETVGQAYKHLGALDQAEHMFREKLRAVDQVWGPGSEQAIRILRQLGDTERMRGRSSDAEHDLRAALGFAERLAPGQDYELAQTLNNLSLVEAAKGDNAHAAEHSRRAVAIIARYPKDPSESFTMQSNLGMILYNDGRAAEAEPILRKVLQERRTLLGENHPQVPTSMRRLATVVASRGGYVEAEQLYREAEAKFRTLLGPDHADVLLTRYYLAGLLTNEGRYPEAEALYRGTIEAERRVAPGGIEIGTWSSALAWTLFLEGKPREAEELLGQALTVVHAKGPGSVSEARTLVKRGSVLSAVRRFDDAQASLDAAFAIYQARKTPAGIDTAEAALAAAFLYRLRGTNEKARALFDQTVSACRGLPEPDELALATVLLAQAEFLIGVNDQEAARPLVPEALAIREKLLPVGSWPIDVAHLVQAELTGSASAAEASLAGLRSKLGDKALFTQAAEERVVEIHHPSRHGAFQFSLF
jgi:serine/threonine-protein kinase